MSKIEKLLKEKGRWIGPDTYETLMIEVNEVLDIIEEVKNKFPVYFFYDVVSGDEWDEKKEGFTPQNIERKEVVGLSLKSYTANALLNRRETIKWFLDNFGDVGEGKKLSDGKPLNSKGK